MLEKSTTIGELSKALVKFQSTVKAVKKDGNNPFFKSKYATLENVISTISGPLSKNGLSFSQFPLGENELATILMHESGEFISASVKMNPKDNTPQGQGSAITYMRRYSLSAILGIATEEDDDGNAASNRSTDNGVARIYKPATAAYKPKSLRIDPPKVIPETDDIDVSDSISPEDAGISIDLSAEREQRKATEDLQRSKIKKLIQEIDPTIDTPAELNAFLKANAMDPKKFGLNEIIGRLQVMVEVTPE